MKVIERKPEKMGAGYYRLGEQEKNKVMAEISIYLAQQAQIVFAFLYGSFLTEKYFRDIDIGIFVETMCPAAFLGYENGIAQQLEQELRFLLPVEIKIINMVPVSFSFQVMRGKLLFSRDDEFLADFMTVTARKYLDMAPLRRHYIREAMA
jgi:uncharacterized protein